MQRNALALIVDYTQARKGNVRPLTLRSQQQVLTQFSGYVENRPPARIRSRDIERWLASISHLAASTRRNRFSVVSGWFKWMLIRHFILHNPCSTVRSPKVPKAVHRALNAEDTARLLAECPDERATLIVILALQLGLRRAEIAGLEIGDINRRSQTVTVTGKGGHQAVLPLTDQATSAVNRYLAASPTTAGPLIRGDRHPRHHVSAEWIGRLVTRLAWNSGIKHARYDGVSTHALRHTAASDVYETTRDVLVVRDLLRQVSLATTQTYVRGLNVEGLRRAIEGRHYG